jgi:hypothetical protein
MIASLIVVSLSLPVHFLLSPQWAFELGLVSEEPPLCRPETPFETAGRYRQGSGKAWRFSRREAKICPRNLFGRRDRNTYYNFVFDRSSQVLEAMGRRAIKIIDETPRGRGLSWSIILKEDVPPEMRPTLLATMQVSLVQALGPGKVLRQRSPVKPHVLLSIGTQTVIDPDLLFYGEVRLIDGAKVLTWKI